MSRRTGIGLPAEVVPFPVGPEYRIRPDLRRLEPGSRHFVSDARWPKYLARKLSLLEADAERCRVIAGDEQALMAVLWRVAELLAVEQPQRFRLEDNCFTIRELDLTFRRDGSYDDALPGAATSSGSNDRVDAGTICPDDPAGSNVRERVRVHLGGLGTVERLSDAIALAVQEDYVIVAGPPGEDRAELLHVCLPSHWNPGDRRGASFAELHAPVPHNSRLLAGSRNLVAAMLAKGPFERSVWSLTDTADLDQNPVRRGVDDARPEADPLDRLWFRSERQTTRALTKGTTPEGGRALFTIRIYVAPLRQVLDPGRAALLAAAIRSMDEELLRYKALVDRRDSLLAALDALASAVH
ncbi:MAG: heme-dependent oxidative N-demethylase subunit alpha family protein [Trueperaceae bacterium]